MTHLQPSLYAVALELLEAEADLAPSWLPDPADDDAGHSALVLDLRDELSGAVEDRYREWKAAQEARLQ